MLRQCLLKLKLPIRPAITKSTKRLIPPPKQLSLDPFVHQEQAIGHNFCPSGNIVPLRKLANILRIYLVNLGKNVGRMNVTTNKVANRDTHDLFSDKVNRTNGKNISSSCFVNFRQHLKYSWKPEKAGGSHKDNKRPIWEQN